MTEPPIFEPAENRRPEYLKLLEIHNTNRIDYNVRKWETLKFFQSIVLTFIGGAVVALTTGIDHQIFCKSAIVSTAFACAIATLPIISGTAAVLAVINLRRETLLLFAEEAQSFKLAKFLNLDVTIPQNLRWIPADINLLMPKWRSSQRDSAPPEPDLDFNGWIARRAKTHRFQWMSGLLFVLEALISLILLGCIIAVYLATQTPISAGKFC